ncbi:FkbM family methyltransferase [Rhizobium sp. TRM95796]|uniref:FkbM family methyltransferase n=1 Tax=Rhizobium sp. TRM95796 TaxID=2979862 RepID=UPI0021E77985|nr:FkbM family methyltransferase [Rhizobium sp. TRM95796]MCV3765728.1 FkbM family methyltransferase [Rhizobium sp. TRM95796]
MPQTDIDSTEQKAKADLKNGNFESALRLFLLLTHRNENLYWYYYHIGQCYLGLRAYETALHYFNIASKNIDDYKINFEIARCYWHMGQTEKFSSHFARHVTDKRFCALTFDMACSQRDFRCSATLWLEFRDIIKKSVSEANFWLNFMDRNDELLSRFAKSSARLSGTFSFSEKFPNFLRILSPSDLEELLTSDSGIHTHFQFSSWDLSVSLKQNKIAQNIPFWLIKLSANEQINFVFDSSEEAPKFSAEEVISFRNIALGANAFHRIAVLTANLDSLNKNYIEHNIETIEYNIYPILISSNYIHKCSTEMDNLKDDINRSFSIMNGMPRPHRQALMMLLKRNDLIANVDYSWWNTSNEKNKSGFSNYAKATKLVFSKLGFSDEEFEWLSNLDEVRIESTGNNTHYMCEDVPRDFLSRSNYHLVSETDFADKNVMRLTEKTLKPIIAGVPFLMVGVPGIVSYLRSLGVDMVDDVIDHSYDDIEDPSDRLTAIAAEIARLQGVAVGKDRLEIMVSKNLVFLKKWHRQTSRAYIGRLNNWLKCIRRENAVPDLLSRLFFNDGKAIRFLIKDQKDVIQNHHYRGTFYEREELEIISRHFPVGGAYVDIGANVGNHAVYVAKNLKPSKIVLVECSPEALMLLRSNIRLNGIDEVVDQSCLGFAVGREHGFVSMKIPQMHNLGSGRVETSSFGSIKMVPGDDLLAHVDKIDFLKIDVEGKEIDVIQGLRKTLERHKPAIFIEVDLKNLAEINALFSALGYRVVDEHQRYRSLTNLMLVSD